MQWLQKAKSLLNGRWHNTVDDRSPFVIGIAEKIAAARQQCAVGSSLPSAPIFTFLFLGSSRIESSSKEYTKSSSNLCCAIERRVDPHFTLLKTEKKVLVQRFELFSILFTEWSPISYIGIQSFLFISPSLTSGGVKVGMFLSCAWRHLSIMVCFFFFFKRHAQTGKGWKEKKEKKESKQQAKVSSTIANH